MRSQQHENKNRQHILDAFELSIKNHPEFSYLVEPLISLTNEIENSISFSQYFLRDDILGKLRQQREKVKSEIIKAEMQLTRFSFDEKRNAIVIAEDGIKSYSTLCSSSELEQLKTKLKQYRNELKDLQNSDDIAKIDLLSRQITDLYESAYEISDFVKKDFDETEGRFYIDYLKSRNALQTMTIDAKNHKRAYGTGSHARHTLIQLCGYVIFIKMLIKEKRYPIIPILVIDHISKPFSDQNIAAIGTIIHKAYENIGFDNLQIFMFDDESSDRLNLKPNHIENLCNIERTGFNPFYKSK